MSFLLLHMYSLMSCVIHAVRPPTCILLHNLCHLMLVNMGLLDHCLLCMMMIYSINLLLKLHSLLLFHHLICLFLTQVSLYLTPHKLRPGAPPAIPPAPVHPTCTYQVPKGPDNAYGDKHPVEQVKEIKHTKCWHDIVWEPGPSRQIPNEPASQMPGNFSNTSAPPAPTPAFAESDSKADIKWLCHEGGAGLATFLMSKAIPHKADSTESKPLCEWTYKDIQTLPAAIQEEWKATCQHELEMLHEHKVYELVDPPKEHKVISNQWVLM